MTEIDIISDDSDYDPDWEYNAPIGKRGFYSLRTYVLNIHRNVEPASPEARCLVHFLSIYRQSFGLAEKLFTEEDRIKPSYAETRPPEPISKVRWRNIALALNDDRGSTVQADPLENGLAMVTAALRFDPLDAAIFAVIFRYQSTQLDRLFDYLANAGGRSASLFLYPDIFSMLLDVPEDEVLKRFRPGSALRNSGAILIDSYSKITLASRMRQIINDCGDGSSDVHTGFLGAPVKATLPWVAFKHLGVEMEIASAMLRQALNTKQAGVHILFYGPPGTGKSQFAATLAAELGAVLHAVGEQDKDGDEPTRGERLSDIMLAQRIIADRKVIYLFDEAEDLFRPSQKEGEPDPKIYVHRLLETATVPMIWAANDLRAFSPAVLRRMSMCIEVKLPNKARRAELWRELAQNEHVELDAQAANRLARLIPSAPSVARTALKAAYLAGGTVETVEIVARGMARAIGHGRMLPPEPPSETSYDPALSRADIDLADLSARLVREDAPKAVSLLLSGPPGTGKSAYARYLAGQMGLPVLQKRGSDIFGMYVGQTEQNIARAFAEAQETNSFLIFDEADSLLAERAGAIRNWEVSEVNEMLTWMEHHPLPFVCTTNLPERLDRASLRRFLIRVTFKYLAPAQSAKLFSASFGAEPPIGLARLDKLVPADFSRIVRRVTALGQGFEPEALLDLLTTEMEGRDGATNPIGFVRARAG
jgi:transitional endoplasmic reticulum ATPase